MEERFFELGKFLYGQIAFVELPVHKLVQNRLVDHGFKSFRRGVCHRTACGFDNVGKHENCSFHALRARALIAEIFFLNFFTSFLSEFFCLVVEVLDERCAVVFLNARCDEFRNLVFIGEQDTLRDVARQDFYGLVRIEVVVRVYALLLVLGEVFRAHGLAQIMVKRHDADEERVGANGFGDAFGKVRNLDAVVERARCEFRNALEGRSVEVGHFHERKDCRNAEDSFDNVDQKHGRDCGKDDDVCTCGNERLVECHETESIAEEKHYADGCCCGNDACNHAPGKLHTVAHAEERRDDGDVDEKACERCCKIVTVQNAKESR